MSESESETPAPEAIDDEQLPEDLQPGEDNPLAEGLEPGEDAGDLLSDGKQAEEGVQTPPPDESDESDESADDDGES
ncbi:hypothetical protein GCM10023340_43070 [Nocardioides marinquilinus]|uniref:Uncharacterized protein n=1 Tax=Nocardioides marinquilinus TaxID=1210400 RepID=A0ABP9Q9N8_9ACTN